MDVGLVVYVTLLNWEWCGMSVMVWMWDWWRVLVTVLMCDWWVVSQARGEATQGKRQHIL